MLISQVNENLWKSNSSGENPFDSHISRMGGHHMCSLVKVPSKIDF